MIRRILLAAALAGVASAALAQSDPIQQRQALFKEMGQATRPVGAMLRGGTFDLASVQAALDLYVKNAAVLPTLFPAGSDKGHDTEALPAVWQRNDEFKALFAQFGTEAAKAKAAITDEASFKATFPGVVRTCGTCHDTFRQKKS